MHILTAPPAGMQIFREMEELARLPAAAQRYIRRSLDVASKSWERLAKMSRNASEAQSIGQQVQLYGRLDALRSAVPPVDDQFAATHFTSLVTELACFDLAQQKIRSFATFRFLYERLLGAATRPWLLTIFVLAVTTARISSEVRTELLRSIDDDSTSGRYSKLEPRFLPEWIDRLDG